MALSGPVARSLAILAWMVLPVLGGYVIWRGWLSGRAGGEALAGRAARALSRAAIIGIATPMMVLLFWKASLPAGKALSLPLVGLLTHSFGGLAGWSFARLGGFDRSRQAACFMGGASSNILTFAAVAALLLLSSAEDPFAERALGELALFGLFEAPFYFLLVWPLAASIASPGGPGWGANFRRAFRPVTVVPVAGIALGWALNLAGPVRPPALDGAAGILVRVNACLLGLSVGLTLRSAAPFRHLGSCLAVSGIKFALVPGAMVGLAWLLGFRGLTLQVTAIAASMPVAFMAVVGSTLFGLEEELVASLWLFSTAAMAAVVPLLALAVPAVALL
jgi:predicted permease